MLSASHTTVTVDPDAAFGDVHGSVVLDDSRDGVPYGGGDGALEADDEEHNCDTFSVGRFWFKSFCLDLSLFSVSTKSLL